MKARVEKLDEGALKRDYPIDRGIDGWFFKVEEKSSGYYIAKATDGWGRIISCEGSDPEELFCECEEKIKGMNV